MELDLASALFRFEEEYQALEINEDGDVEDVAFQICQGFLMQAMKNLYTSRYASTAGNFSKYFLACPSDEGKMDRAGKLVNGIATVLSNFGLCQMAIHGLNLPQACHDKFSEELRPLLVSAYCVNASTLTQTEAAVHHQLYQLGASIEDLRGCGKLQESLRRDPTTTATSLVLFKAVFSQIHQVAVAAGHPDASEANGLLQHAAGMYFTCDEQRMKVLLAFNVKQEEMEGLNHGTGSTVPSAAACTTAEPVRVVDLVMDEQLPPAAVSPTSFERKRGYPAIVPKLWMTLMSAMGWTKRLDRWSMAYPGEIRQVHAGRLTTCSVALSTYSYVLSGCRCCGTSNGKF